MSDHSNIQKLLVDAWAQRREGQYDGARQLVAEAEASCAEDDFRSLGRIYHIYAQFESDNDKPAKALEYCRQSVAHYQQSGDRDKIAHATRHLADIERRLGNAEESELHYRHAIEIYRQNSSTSAGDFANALRGFALTLEQREKTAEAIATWEKVKEFYGKCNLQAGVDEAKERLAGLR